MTEPSLELFAIGNEVLQGDVLDTNSHWLCQQLRARGARVTRITVLPDIPFVIRKALQEGLDRGPAAILTCGGLGPTVDDLTLSAIAELVGRPLIEHPVALAMVTELYRRLYEHGMVSTPEVTPARRKMASLPAGSLPLPNAVGAAPGVWLEVESGLIACLPGVPAELKAIFNDALWPRLAAHPAFDRRPAFIERILPTTCYDESFMAPAVDQVAARHPLVYVKSRAQAYGSGQADFVTLSTRAADDTEANRLLNAAESDLREALAAIGISITG